LIRFSTLFIESLRKSFATNHRRCSIGLFRNGAFVTMTHKVEEKYGFGYDVKSNDFLEAALD
jgi:hypothetical protein